MQIYLDHSATTPPAPEAIALMQQVMAEQWGNPASLHSWGQRAATVLERARIQVAHLLQADPTTIVFTSGGTEANHLAIFGVTRRYAQPQHLIISSVEHGAIAQPVQWLEQRGWQVTRLPVDGQGRVDPGDLEAALQRNTVLISVIYGQSEVGTVQPIAQLGAIARRHAIPFHTDAVQVAGRIPLDVQQLPIDFLSLSSHKLYGPQGAGALYIHPDQDPVPLLMGGGQERGWRSGTPAVPAIAGFGVAAVLAAQALPTETLHLLGLRDRLLDRLQDHPHLQPTGPWGPSLQQQPLARLPHHLSFCLVPSHPRAPLPSGQALVQQMGLAGIAISAGSACHSGQATPSPTLLAMGYPEDQARTALRLTLGRATSPGDVDWTALVLEQILDRLMPQLSLTPV